MRIIFSYVLIIFISVTFSLYLTEGYLKFKNIKYYENNSKKIKIYKKEKNKDFDVRLKSQVYKDLKIENLNITSEAAPKLFNDPSKKLYFLSGISNSKTIGCNENGYFSIYETDRYGFNNPDKEWEKKEIHYLLLGDSYTQGNCVNRPDDITSVLRDITKKSALNFGFRGNGPLSNYASLIEFYSKKTKNILWLHFEGNDLTDLKSELTNKILVNYYTDRNFTQNLAQNQNYVDKQTKKIIQKLQKKEDVKIKFNYKNTILKYEILKFIRLNHTKKLIKSVFKKKEKVMLPLKEFEDILILTKKFALKNNSNFYFVYLPQYERYTQRVNDKNYDHVKQIISKLDLNFIDLHEELFNKQENPLKLFPFEMLGHYNETGYEKIGKLIHSRVKD